MKKVFLLIFCGLLFNISELQAEVFSITDVDAYRSQAYKNPADAIAPDLPDPNDEEAVRKFFKERIEHAAVTQVGADDDYTTPSSVSVVHTPEYYKEQEENNKPLFQKMYEEAVQALQKKENDANYGTGMDEEQAAATATRFFTINAPKKPRVIDEYAHEQPIPTIGFSLPSGRRMLAPALEHIPYFLSYIDIQANGYLKVEDTIIVVADGNKFLKPMERHFDKYVYDNRGHAQKIEFILSQVTVNDVEVPYLTEEFGNEIILKSKYPQELDAGVYTYKFNYLVNYGLQIAQNNVVMNWHLTGQPLNAFITSANAIVTLPSGQTFKNLQGIVGKAGKYTNRRTNIIPLSSNAAAVSNFTPLLNGENMRIIAVVDKNAFLPNFNDTFGAFMFNWGSVMYAVLGLLAICSAYIISLLSLKHRKQIKYTPAYNGSLMRQILTGKYDRIAFVAQILDLYRKQALDIINENNRIFLICKNLTGKKLNSVDKKALKRLFAKHTEKIEINTTHSLLLKNVSRIFEKNNAKQIKKYNVLHNISYVIFSCIMLILTEIFIAFISTNTAQMLIILLATSTLYAFYLWILYHKFKNRFTNILIKICVLLIITALWVFSSVYIGGITNIIILLMITIIFAFTKIFQKRDNFIDEALNSIRSYKEHLIINADNINLSRDFINHQSGIFALDITEYFPQNAANKTFYKLEIAEQLHRCLVGIL